MAQKQYSFDFVLNAVLNGGFSGTFTKAQQEFVRLGNEIKNLQAIQRDIAAYQKQAAAVQNTSGKLENLRRQYELVNRQISETTGSTTALERAKLKLEQRIDNTEAALEKQRAKLDETKDRLNVAGVSTDDLAAKDAALTEKIKELTEEQKKAAEGAGEFRNAGVEAIDAVGGAIAAAGIAEAVKGIADAYEECVGVAADFEQAMSAVEAIAEANNREMTALKAEAKELGATTIHTAQQSANAMEYMAMAGWDAQEMLSGMGGVINLAAAAGEDLAQVSDIVTDNLSAFRLQASDTAHFVDVLAAAAAKSNTNISIMGETFKSSSSVAGALEYSIEDVAVMVGLMANNAVKGSRAGTALRNIFNGLLGGITLTARAFGELDYSAVNYDGSMKGLMETVEDLRGYFDLMTESEKVMNAQNIAGMRGYNGLLAILNATDEDFQSLYASINNCTGAAQRMASVKLDNLNGDITLANSAMEALQSTIGEQFNPELRELTQLKTELLNGLNIFIQENPALAKGIMAGAAAFGVLGTAVVGVNAAMKIFQALNLAALFTGPAGVLLGIAGGIAAVTAVVVGATEAMRDGGQAVRELTEAAREMGEAMGEAKASYEDTAASTLAATDVANFYIDKLEEMGNATQLSDDEQRRYQNTLALLLQVMPSLSDCISQTTDEYGRATYTLETTTEALRNNTEEWKRNAQTQAYQEYLNSMMEQYNGVMLEAAENEIGLTKARYNLEAASQEYNAAMERMNELASKDAEWTEEEWEEYYRLQEAILNCQNQMNDAENSVLTYTAAVERDKKAIAEAEEEMSLMETVVKDLMKTMGLYTDEQESLTAAESAVREALDSTRARVDELTNAYAEAYLEAKKSYEGQFGLFDEAKTDADATVEEAQKALDTQLKYWQDYAANIAAMKEISADDLNTTEENYNALMEYVRDGGPEAAGLIADMVKAINDGNTQALTDLANTLGEISESQDQAAQDTADWTVGLTKQMNQLIHDMEEEIGALDMSAETALYGHETVQGWIDGAGEMEGPLQNAIARLVSAAKEAMYSNVYGYAQKKEARALSEGANAFASGTDNAPPGWAWVGEEGPELMRMHGGEQILPNSVSRKVMEEYNTYTRYAAANGIRNDAANRAAEDYGEYRKYTNAQGVQQARQSLEVTTTEAGKVEMHFHIEAGASPETVDVWQNYARSVELKALVLEVMEDADTDARRRTMV